MMGTVAVEVEAVRPAGGGWPWPTLLATVLEGPTCGERVVIAAEGPGLLELADVLEAGERPAVTVEPWRIVGAA
jgi:hypothetical protein